MCASRPIGAIAASISMAVLLVATGWPARARAEPEHVHIRFLAPQGCPDTAAFIRALRQRTPRFRRATDSEKVRTFVATITKENSAFLGRLQTQAPGKEPSERSVTGQTCDDVMRVLAFMTALAIDPNAQPPGLNATRPVSSSLASQPRTAPADASDRTMAGAAAEGPIPQQPTPASEPPPPPPEPRAADKPVGLHGRTDAPPRAVPSLEAESAPAAAAAAASSAEAAPRWSWSTGADGEASLGLLPTAGFGGLLFVEAAAPGRSVLGPVLRAGLFLNQSHELLTKGAQAELQWVAARLEGCPARLFFFDSVLAAHACLDFQLGALRGQGRNLDRSQKTTDLWADLGMLARARVAISARLFLEAQGMLVVPLRRLTYQVYDAGPSGTATTVHRVPRLGVLVGIGMGYQFR